MQSILTYWRFCNEISIGIGVQSGAYARRRDAHGEAEAKGSRVAAPRRRLPLVRLAALPTPGAERGDTCQVVAAAGLLTRGTRTALEGSALVTTRRERRLRISGGATASTGRTGPEIAMETVSPARSTERRAVRASRSVALVLLLAIAAIPLALAGRSTTPSSASLEAPTSSCGVERWTVKTLQDRPVPLPVQRTTVAALVRLPRPYSFPGWRMRFERHIFQVVAPVTLVRPEDDKDLHIVLRARRKSMIAESPAWSCTRKAKLYRRRQMARARQAVRICRRARVTGVAFSDFKHGQTGVAPNAIELHPILGFTCLA